MRIILCLLSFVYITSCQDSDTFESDGFSLIGEWKLIEYCASIGDASCPKKTPDFEQRFNFLSDSRFDYILGGNSCSGTYVRSASNQVIFSSTEENCINQNMILLIINDNQIELNPTCREQCTYLYKRI